MPIPQEAQTRTENVSTLNGVPELKISHLAPTERLTESARATLNSQWQRFWEV
jgi:hypothetical protein